MRSIAIVDAGPLLASIDRRDPHNASCLEVLRRRDLDLMIPALVVAEVAYLAGARLGPRIEAAFLRGLTSLDVRAPDIDDWPRIADMVERYADLRLGTTDASIAVLADRFRTDLVITLDRRHFEAIRSPDGRAFRILPELRRTHEEPATYESHPA